MMRARRRVKFTKHTTQQHLTALALPSVLGGWPMVALARRNGLCV